MHTLDNPSYTSDDTNLQSMTSGNGDRKDNDATTMMTHMGI